MNITHVIATITCGSIGGIIGKKLKIPAGSFIGALLFVAILNIATSIAVFPPLLRVFVQIFSGIIIGSRFAKKDITSLKRMLTPALILAICLLTITTIFAYFISVFTNLDLTTAFFSCAPGGVSDLALIAADLGANPEQVALLQLGRFTFVLLFFPVYIKTRYIYKNNSVPIQQNKDMLAKTMQNKKTSVSMKNRSLNIVSIIIGIFGGFLFRYLHIPAGAIIGAIVFTILANFFIVKVNIPTSIKHFVQILAGCYIGSQINQNVAVSIPSLFLPLCILLLGILVMAFLCAYIIYKITGLDYVTCLFSCIPGGLAEMGIIADDLELDTPKIIVMHTVRLIAVICFFPLLAYTLL